MIHPGFQAIYGAHSCLAALKYNSRQAFRRLYIAQHHRQVIQEVIQQEQDEATPPRWNPPPRSTKDMKKQAEWRCSLAAQMALQRNIPMEFVEQRAFDSMVGTNATHNGLVLEGRPMKIPQLKDATAMQRLAETHRKRHKTASVEQERPLCYLVLDEIQDVNNFGAIVRSAAFYGLDAVIVSTKNSCPLTAAVGNASAGALEIFHATNRLYSVNKINQALTYSSSAGILNLAAASAKEDQYSYGDIQEITHRDKLIVMGNEATGIRKSVLQNCDFKVAISPPGINADSGVNVLACPYVGLDSLNVSCATASILQAICQSRIIEDSVKLQKISSASS